MKNNKKIIIFVLITCFLFSNVFCMNNTLAKKHKHKYVTTTIYKQKDKKHEDGKHIKIKTMKCTVKGCKQKVTIKSEENHNWRNYKKTSKKSKHTKYCLGCFKEK